MKKLFVSVPKEGRHLDAIKESVQKMKKIAECFEGEELELLNRYAYDFPPEKCNMHIWDFAKSIEQMAQAAVFIGILEPHEWRECEAENYVASLYGIKQYMIAPELALLEDINY